MKRTISVLFLLGLACLSSCSEPTVNFSGRWDGTAEIVVDGERKVFDLRWDLEQLEGDLKGTIGWDDLRREVTKASVEGPQLHLESVTTENAISFNGLFREDEIQGRFSIRYSVDPETYPGSFRMHRGK
jgi:hypothetical protein